MERILNLTQHPATPEQVAAGVFEPRDKQYVRSLLTFTSAPTIKHIRVIAMQLAIEACGYDCTKVMIGGAPYLMPELEEALWEMNMTPVYSFSERVSVETTNADGSVTKTNVFKHTGFIEKDYDPVYKDTWMCITA